MEGRWISDTIVLYWLKREVIKTMASPFHRPSVDLIGDALKANLLASPPSSKAIKKEYKEMGKV